MDPLMELKQKRSRLFADAEAIYKAADKEKRSLSAEEQEKFDGLMDQIDELDKDIKRREALLGHRVEDPILPDPEETPAIGMSDKEVRQYSLLRAINAKLTGDWSKAGLEREASLAVEQRVGRPPDAKGFFVPYDWMVAERRDLIKGTAAQGGYLVGTEHLAQSFIEMLRNKMVVLQAGARFMGGLVGDIAIPKQTGGATAYWVDPESASVTESQQAVDQLALSPNTVGALTDISRKLLLQATPDAEDFVRDDLARVVALAIDLASLHGSGSGAEPTGIANTTGVATVAIGANGGDPTWDHIVDLETEVAQDNADVGALAYITNAKVRGKLKRTMRTATYGDIPIWDPQAGDRPLNGYPVYVTNQVKSNLTKGSGTNLSAIFFGNWADLIIAQWGGLEILVDPYTGGASGAVRIIALQDVDIGVRHPESFSVILDAVTT